MEQDINNQVFEEAQEIIDELATIVFTEYDGKIIYHYTSPIGLKEIVSSGKLWFTKSDYLNDTSELNYIFETLEKSIDKGKYNHDFCKYIRNEFIENEQRSFNLSKYDYYICSLSTEQDGLSLWNYYTKSESKAGYNIAFNSLKLMKSLGRSTKELRFDMGDIIYDQDEQDDLWNKVLFHLNQVYVDNIDLCKNKNEIFSSITNTLIDVVLMYAPFIKHPAFANERERRIVYRVLKTKIENVQVREQHGIFVPYLEIPFDINLIKSITISPYVQSDAKMKSIQMLATKYKLNVECIASNIPIRF